MKPAHNLFLLLCSLNMRRAARIGHSDEASYNVGDTLTGITCEEGR